MIRLSPTASASSAASVSAAGRQARGATSKTRPKATIVALAEWPLGKAKEETASSCGRSAGRGRPIQPFCSSTSNRPESVMNRRRAPPRRSRRSARKYCAERGRRQQDRTAAQGSDEADGLDQCRVSAGVEREVDRPVAAADPGEEHGRPYEGEGGERQRHQPARSACQPALGRNGTMPLPLIRPSNTCRPSPRRAMKRI